MKIAVIWEYDRAKWTVPIQHDGLKAAMDIIAQKHQVDWFLEGEVPGVDDGYNFVCIWGVGSLPSCDTVEKYIHAKKLLFCAGHYQDTKNFEKFDHIFVESPKMYHELYPFYKNLSIAFGVNVDLFKPDTQEPKILDVFFCATYSLWKRQDLFGQSVVGLKALTCGTMQPDGVSLYDVCNASGVYTQVGLMPSKLVSQLYQMSKVCAITAYHGSERSMLESLASNVPLVLVRDNELGVSLVEDQAIIVEPNPVAIRAGIELALKKENVNTREWVEKKYSHKIYAQKILEVLEQ